MKIRELIILTLVTGWLISCGNKSGVNNAMKNDITDTSKEEMFVWAENARVRDKADLGGAVVAELKSGDKVTLTGEESTNKTMINLRGVDFTDVWVKVTTAGGKEGWMFKPMLTSNIDVVQAMNDLIIVPGERVGALKLGTTLEENERIFGKSFVQKGDIFFPEGLTAPGFFVFKNSTYELQCVVDKDKKVSQIMIRNPNALWHTQDFIKNGMTLDDLAKMNGKPVKFSGFGWDYGGAVLDFNGGKLSKYDMLMAFELGEPDNIDGLDDCMGDVECSTSDKNVLGKGIKVVELTIFNTAPAI